MHGETRYASGLLRDEQAGAARPPACKFWAAIRPRPSPAGTPGPAAPGSVCLPRRCLRLVVRDVLQALGWRLRQREHLREMVAQVDRLPRKLGVGLFLGHLSLLPEAREQGWEGSCSSEALSTRSYF